MNKSLKESIYDLIARDELHEAIEILLNQLPENKIDEMILQSARFNDLQKQIRLGLIDYKEQSLTKSQIRYGIIEFLKTLEGSSHLSVLVAGTGRYNLPEDVYLIAKCIGAKLGKEGMKLICGGWEGVDFVVADEYSKSANKNKTRLSENLIQVVSESREPVFKGGDVIYVREGIKEWQEAIKYADVVLLIGGEGGTYETYIYAHQEGRPIIPIPSVGGDSKNIHQEIVEKWNYWQNTFFKAITKQDFNMLNFPVDGKPEKAEVLSDIVINLIKKIK